MIAASALLLIAFAAVLVLVTLVQTLYLDTLRLRSRDLPFLERFRAEFVEPIGLKTERGALTFSLIKHTLLPLSGVAMVTLNAGTGTVSAAVIVEAGLFTWFYMLVTTYIVPQTLYRHTTGAWMRTLLPLIRVFALAVRPLTAMLQFLQSLAQLREADESAEEQPAQADSIEALISAGTEEGIIEEQDRKLIQSVVAFGDKTVREVMTPRPGIVATSADASLEDLRQLVIHEQFSRIPVYEGVIDNITGFVHVRDMFELDYVERSSRKVNDVVRPIRFVPETKPVNDLLREMQQDGNHIAIVVDEYGNTAGLVTMEDMVEEIVGEIRDEHEPGEDVQRDAGGFIVSGSFDVDHLQELLEFRASEETESTTVGGLVTEWMGRVPHQGETVERDGIRIEILASNALRVDQVRISKVEAAANEATKQS